MEDVRRGFIQKVYATVAVQLMTTAVIAAPIVRADSSWLRDNSGLFMLATMGSFVLVTGVMCCAQHILRTHPWNFVFLAVFTVLESVAVGFISAQYEIESVVLCLAGSGVVAAALTLFACTTKMDFTNMGGSLMIAAFGLFGVGMLGAFFRIPMMQTMYAIGGACLFGVYLIYDTQLILGGKHQKKRFEIDDYVLAAMNIYMDLIELFIFLLRMFGERRRE